MPDDDGAQLPELVVGPLLDNQGNRVPKRQCRNLAGHRLAVRALKGTIERKEIDHLVEIVGCNHNPLQ